MIDTYISVHLTDLRCRPELSSRPKNFSGRLRRRACFPRKYVKLVKIWERCWMKDMRPEDFGVLGWFEMKNCGDHRWDHNLGQALCIFWTPSLDACQKLCCNAVLEGFKHGLWPLLDTHPDRYAELSVCSFGPLCRTGKTTLILGCKSVAKTMVFWYAGRCQCDAWEHNFVYIFGTSTWRLHKAVQPLIPRRSMLVRTPCLRSSSCFQKVRDWKNSQMKTSTSSDVITSAWATTISLQVFLQPLA